MVCRPGALAYIDFLPVTLPQTEVWRIAWLSLCLLDKGEGVGGVQESQTLVPGHQRRTSIQYPSSVLTSGWFCEF